MAVLYGWGWIYNDLMQHFIHQEYFLGFEMGCSGICDSTNCHNHTTSGPKVDF